MKHTGCGRGWTWYANEEGRSLVAIDCISQRGMVGEKSLIQKQRSTGRAVPIQILKKKKSKSEEEEEEEEEKE